MSVLFTDVLLWAPEEPSGMTGPTDLLVDRHDDRRGGSDRAGRRARRRPGRRRPRAPRRAARARQRALPLAGEPPQGRVPQPAARDLHALRVPVGPGPDADPARGVPPDDARRARDAPHRDDQRAGRRVPHADARPRGHRRRDAGVRGQRDPGLRRARPAGAARRREAAVPRRHRARRPRHRRGDDPRAARPRPRIGRGPARRLRPPVPDLARGGRRSTHRGRVDLRSAAGLAGVLRRARRPQPHPRRAALRPHARDTHAACPLAPVERPAAVRRTEPGPLHGGPGAAQRPGERHPRGLGRRRRPRPDRRGGRGRRAQPGVATCGSAAA